jgi:hypothetical protein
MKYSKKFLLTTIFFGIAGQALVAQIFTTKTYPKDYFSNPLNIPINLAGNLGELRPNHYHMGLDIKTQQRENLPVHAAADGYVSRIKIEPAGFGRAIYINHPNGYTTVYCHLNDFNPQIEAWVKQQQYNLESWKVFLDVPANLFVVKKGDFIAYSGSTGGSQAPHVHFEIRKTADDVNVNPMLFGFPISDNTSPVITRLALYNRLTSVYEQTPRMLPIKKIAGGYETSQDVVTVSNAKVSFAVGTYDTQSGSSNQNGVFQGELYDNDKAVIGFEMDNISYDETRYINAHVDYKMKANGGPYVEHLSELPGYIHSIYKKVSGDGVIDLSDKAVHNIKIIIKDAYGNSSSLKTKVQWNGSVTPASTAAGKMFYPMMLDVSENPECEFYMGERCLYDSVHIAYKTSAATAPAAVSAIHTIGAPYVPLQEPMVVRIKPNKALSPEEQSKVVMQRFAGAKKEVMAVEWNNGWASAKFRDFGSYQLLVDNEPPVITPVGFANGSNVSHLSRLVISVKDNFGKYKNFRAELDGKWLRFTNDKGLSFIYKMDEKFLPGTHTLKISVEDEAGNKSEKEFTLTR